MAERLDEFDGKVEDGSCGQGSLRSDDRMGPGDHAEADSDPPVVHRHRERESRVVPGRRVSGTAKRKVEQN